MEKIHLDLNKEFNIEGNGTLDVFILDTTKPMILICPGGGYHHLSPRESLPVVNKFLSFGYNCALLRYSVAPFSYPTQLNEINNSIKYLSKSFQDLFLMGFSAGGHLSGLGGTDIYHSLIKGMILCYPVISLNKYTHLGTQQNLLKDMNTPLNQEKFSICNRVSEETAPTFIWCTKTDQAVPYENSLMMKDALDKHGVYNELKVFPFGPHGMALADDTATIEGHDDCKNPEVATWVNYADKFIKKVVNHEVK